MLENILPVLVAAAVMNSSLTFSLKFFTSYEKMECVRERMQPKGLITWEFLGRVWISAQSAGLKLASNYMNVSSRAVRKDIFHPGLEKICDYMRNLSPFKRVGNPSPPSWRMVGIPAGTEFSTRAEIISCNHKINFAERWLERRAELEAR